MTWLWSLLLPPSASSIEEGLAEELRFHEDGGGVPSVIGASIFVSALVGPITWVLDFKASALDAVQVRLPL